MVVFGLGKSLLFKSNLGHCEYEGLFANVKKYFALFTTHFFTNSTCDVHKHVCSWNTPAFHKFHKNGIYQRA